MKLYFGLCLYISAILVAESAKIKIEPRLINGETAQQGQFPWQVGVVAVRQSLVNYCGGAIISERWVLTAASCVYYADSVVVMYGTLDLENPSNNVSVFKNYVVHQDYDDKTLRNDIGLIFLNLDLEFNDKVQPIALAEKELKTGSEVTVSGWGLTKNDDPNHKYDVLRYVSVKTIDNQECLEVYGPGVVLPGVVCTEPGDPVKNPCQGDAGDPGVVNRDTNPVLVALFSFTSSFGCENSVFPAGFTRVAYYRDWIRQVSGI